MKKDDPLAKTGRQMIDYDEISERIKDLESANDTLLDDNRTLSARDWQRIKESVGS